MSFVLTAQFVLVNVVIAVLMKHLEESNKEAKEEAEMEAELEMESRAQLEDMTPRSPQLNSLAVGLDRLSSGGSPWRSPGEKYREQGGDVPMDSPTVDMSRDSVNIRADPPSCLEPTLEVLHLYYVSSTLMPCFLYLYFCAFSLKNTWSLALGATFLLHASMGFHKKQTCTVNY